MSTRTMGKWLRLHIFSAANEAPTVLELELRYKLQTSSSHVVICSGMSSYLN